MTVVTNYFSFERVICQGLTKLPVAIRLGSTDDLRQVNVSQHAFKRHNVARRPFGIAVPYDFCSSGPRSTGPSGLQQGVTVCVVLNGSSPRVHVGNGFVGIRLSTRDILGQSISICGKCILSLLLAAVARIHGRGAAFKGLVRAWRAG